MFCALFGVSVLLGPLKLLVKRWANDHAWSTNLAFRFSPADRACDSDSAHWTNQLCHMPGLTPKIPDRQG